MSKPLCVSLLTLCCVTGCASFGNNVWSARLQRRRDERRSYAAAPALAYPKEDSVATQHRPVVCEVDGGGHCPLPEGLFDNPQPFANLRHATANLEQTATAETSAFHLTSVEEALGSAETPLDYAEQTPREPLTLFQRIVEDHRNYYSRRNLAFLGVGFGAGSLIANTQLDREIYDHFNDSIAQAPSDEWSEAFHSPKDFGDGLYTLPLFAAVWGVGKLYDDTFLGNKTAQWGERCLRTFVVGAPPLILMQKVTGGGRPIEGDSHWDFWDDSNGVSGHSFMGAFPFLVAAQVADRPLPKWLLYAASTAVPLSRVTDGDHYTSQALLGWWMAWSATMAVDATQDGDTQWRTMPLITRDFSGFAIELRW